MLEDVDRGGAAGASVRAQGPLDAPGAGSKSQLGAKIAGPGDGSKSMIDDAARKGAAGASVREQGPLDPPGVASKSQLGDKIAAPGDGSKSMIDDAARTGAAAQAPKAPANGPGAAAKSRLGDKIDAPGGGSESMLDDEARKGAAGSTVRDEGPIDAPGEDAVSMLTGQVFAAAPDPTSTRGRKTAGFDGSEESNEPDAQVYGDTPREEEAEAARSPHLARAVDEAGAATPPAVAALDAAQGAAKAPKKRRKQRKSRMWLYLTIGLTASVVLLGIVGFAVSYFGRGSDPERAALEQLLIAQDASRVVRVGGADTLIVDGHISNNGAADQRLRPLRLELYNDRKEILQSVTTNPCATILSPGGACSYQVRIRLPDTGGAKPNFAVVWGELTETPPP
jgi:hypothetical protein